MNKFTSIPTVIIMTDNSNVSYTDILVELLAENPTFNNMCGAIDNVFGANINYPTDQLLRLRSLTQADDISLRQNTMRMLGYDVSRDFITLNGDISQLPSYMFSLYYLHAHSNDFWRFISYVLGKDVVVTPLYTNDYLSFYDKPYGTLNVDGGDWYLTTTVDVSIDIDGLSELVVANIDNIFQNRVLDLFYEFSPINLVIRNFMFSLSMGTTISFVAAAIFDVEIMYIGGYGSTQGQPISQLTSITINGLNSVVAGATTQYQLSLTWAIDTPTWQFLTQIQSGTTFIQNPLYGQQFYLSNSTTVNGVSYLPGLYAFGEWVYSASQYGEGTTFPVNPTGRNRIFA